MTNALSNLSSLFADSNDDGEAQSGHSKDSSSAFDNLLSESSEMAQTLGGKVVATAREVNARLKKALQARFNIFGKKELPSRSFHVTVNPQCVIKEVMLVDSDDKNKAISIKGDDILAATFGYNVPKSKEKVYIFYIEIKSSNPDIEKSDKWYKFVVSPELVGRKENMLEIQSAYDEISISLISDSRSDMLRTSYLGKKDMYLICEGASKTKESKDIRITNIKAEEIKVQKSSYCVLEASSVENNEYQFDCKKVELTNPYPSYHIDNISFLPEKFYLLASNLEDQINITSSLKTTILFYYTMEDDFREQKLIFNYPSNFELMTIPIKVRSNPRLVYHCRDDRFQIFRADGYFIIVGNKKLECSDTALRTFLPSMVIEEDDKNFVEYPIDLHELTIRDQVKINSGSNESEGELGRIQLTSIPKASEDDKVTQYLLEIDSLRQNREMVGEKSDDIQYTYRIKKGTDGYKDNSLYFSEKSCKIAVIDRPKNEGNLNFLVLLLGDYEIEVRDKSFATHKFQSIKSKFYPKPNDSDITRLKAFKASKKTGLTIATPFGMAVLNSTEDKVTDFIKVFENLYVRIISDEDLKDIGKLIEFFAKDLVKYYVSFEIVGGHDSSLYKFFTLGNKTIEHGEKSSMVIHYSFKCNSFVEKSDGQYKTYPPKLLCSIMDTNNSKAYCRKQAIGKLFNVLTSITKITGPQMDRVHQKFEISVKVKRHRRINGCKIDRKALFSAITAVVFVASSVAVIAIIK